MEGAIVGVLTIFPPGRILIICIIFHFLSIFVVFPRNLIIKISNISTMYYKLNPYFIAHIYIFASGSFIGLNHRYISMFIHERVEDNHLNNLNNIESQKTSLIN